jgi:hypothetical protein
MKVHQTDCKRCNGVLAESLKNTLTLDALAHCYVHLASDRDAMREALQKIVNITDGHAMNADRRDRISELARAGLAEGARAERSAD